MGGGRPWILWTTCSLWIKMFENHCRKTLMYNDTECEIFNWNAAMAWKTLTSGLQATLLLSPGYTILLFLDYCSNDLLNCHMLEAHVLQMMWCDSLVEPWLEKNKNSRNRNRKRLDEGGKAVWEVQGEVNVVRETRLPWLVPGRYVHTCVFMYMCINARLDISFLSWFPLISRVWLLHACVRVFVHTALISPTGWQQGSLQSCAGLLSTHGYT